jgi:hypothetical protein
MDENMKHSLQYKRKNWKKLLTLSNLQVGRLNDAGFICFKCPDKMENVRVSYWKVSFIILKNNTLRVSSRLSSTALNVMRFHSY